MGGALLELAGELGEALGEPLLLVRHDGSVAATTPPFERLLGDTASGRTLFELVRDSADSVRSLLRRASRTRSPIPAGLTLSGADGDVRVRARAALLRPDSPPGSGLLLLRMTPAHESRIFAELKESIAALNREVVGWREQNSEREALIRQLEVAQRELATANQELAYRTSLLSAVTENAVTALFFIDERARPTYMNQAAIDLFQYELGEIRNVPLHEAIHSRRGDGRRYRIQECPIVGALGRGQPIGPYEDMFHCRSGQPIPVRVVANPLVSGETRGTVIEIQDIRAQKRHEEQVEQLTRELLETVNYLRTANAAKDEFLGLVSHELRTPITVISGNARSLLTHYVKLDDETRRAAIADVMSESDRLQRLIENMLVLSRIERGRTIEREPVLLGRLAPAIVAEARRAAPGRRIVLKLPPTLPPVLAAPQSVEQMLLNLVNNAHKYSPAGTEIDVCLAHDGGQIAIRVLDRGPGVPAAEAAQLFSPFYRSPETAREVQGAGLGLAVCQRLAEAQGGRTWYKPRPSGGAEFGFALPVMPDEHPNATNTAYLK